jgi:hypothetical protein
MEEKIIDEEIGRKIRVKKTQDGETDIVDDLAEENEELAEGEEEYTFELPEYDDDDEDLVGLSPEEAMALRKKKQEEAAAKRAEYERLLVEGEALLGEGSYRSAELKFEKALMLDEVATEATVGYWRAKTENFSNPDGLMDEYVEEGYDSLEWDLGAEAVAKIRETYQEQFRRRYDELVAEEAPLRAEFEEAQARRRSVLKPRRLKCGIGFGVSALPFLVSLILTAVFGFSNFTVKDDRYILPTIIAGCVAFVAFIVFGIFTNRFINACRIYNTNERLSSTDEGAKLEEIEAYKSLYHSFL